MILNIIRIEETEFRLPFLEWKGNFKLFPVLVRPLGIRGDGTIHMLKITVDDVELIV